MKKVEIILRPEKLEVLKELLDKKKITGMTVYNVMGCGNQKGKKEKYRGSDISIYLLPKVKTEIVIDNKKVDDLILDLRRKLKTGEVGDGKIFVSDIEQVIRIRTGERDVRAI